METPVNYGLFEQTVTVYHPQAGGIRRTVYTGAYLQGMESVKIENLQKMQEKKFLLILPGEDVVLFPGDRVYDGEGPEVSADQWDRFLPVTQPRLYQIGYVKPFCWQGILSHTEAGL